MARIAVKRVYEAAEPEDGFRVLVDRIWPRGVSKTRANVALWLPSVAPTAELRRWFAHRPDRWDGFCQRYFAELDANPSGLEPLLERASKERVTLVYSARDCSHNQAVALKRYLDRRRPGS